MSKKDDGLTNNQNLNGASDQNKQTGSDQTKAEEKLKQLQDRVTSLEDQLKRAVADYHNLEKRVNEGRIQLTEWTTAELIKKLLPVLDHLEKALVGVSDEDRKSGWLKGVELSVTEFKYVLKSEGLEEIEVKDKFDPNLHEAVDTREGEDNKILEMVRKGYRLNGKVLRPAQVVVGRKEPERETEEQREKTVDTGDYV